VSSKSTIAARLEYYSDVNGVIISTGTPHGFQTYGYSLNLDYKIAENVIWRIEGKSFSSTDKIFILDNKPNNNNYVATTSLAVSF